MQRRIRPSVVISARALAGLCLAASVLLLPRIALAQGIEWGVMVGGDISSLPDFMRTYQGGAKAKEPWVYR